MKYGPYNWNFFLKSIERLAASILKNMNIMYNCLWVFKQTWILNISFTAGLWFVCKLTELVEFTVWRKSDVIKNHLFTGCGRCQPQWHESPGPISH